MKPAFLVGAIWFSLTASSAWGQTMRAPVRTGGTGGVRAVPSSVGNFSGNYRQGARLSPITSVTPGFASPLLRGAPAVGFRPGLGVTGLPSSLIPTEAGAAPSVESAAERATWRDTQRAESAEAFGANPWAIPSGDGVAGHSAFGWNLDDRSLNGFSEPMLEGAGPVRGWTAKSAALDKELGQARPIEQVDMESADVFGRRLSDIMTGEDFRDAVNGREVVSGREAELAAWVGSGLSNLGDGSGSEIPGNVFADAGIETTKNFNNEYLGTEQQENRNGNKRGSASPAAAFRGPVKLIHMTAVKLGLVLFERPAKSVSAFGREESLSSVPSLVENASERENGATEKISGTEPNNFEQVKAALARRVSSPLEETASFAAIAAEQAASAASPYLSRRSARAARLISLPSVGKDFPGLESFRQSPAAPAALLLLGLAPLLSLTFKRD